MIVVDYIKALLLPSGRLPRMSYIAMILPLGFLHAVFYRLALQCEGDDVYGFYGGALLFVIWMKFCVVSRRMHDLGRPNQIAAGLLLISVFIFLAELDPRLIGKTEEAREYWSGILDLAASGLRLVWLLVSIELFKQEGEGGANMYGPEFGDAGRSQDKAHRAALAMADGYAAQRGVITVGRGVVEAPTGPAPRRWTPIVPLSPEAAQSMRQPNPFVPG